MENNHEQQEANNQVPQEQSNPVQVQSVTSNLQSAVYPKQESFFGKVFQDKQKLLLVICSLGLFVGIINSIALIHVLCRQDRPEQVMYHNGMMLPGGQGGKFYFEDKNGEMRGNMKGNQPNIKGKSFNIEGGTFEMPGGGTIEIKPGD